MCAGSNGGGGGGGSQTGRRRKAFRCFRLCPNPLLNVWEGSWQRLRST